MISEFEKLVLISICKATNTSKSAHNPKPYFMKKFQNNKHQRKAAERALLSLIARGYVSKHPTRGEMTYGLTGDGLAICREILKH
ncbi:MAG: hypothetical protein MUO26_05105 [Methanotrichaceae archaeon]|nr:hypothetical protein [Methanotrichaceae archaeon]